jgi:hypothetical protein
MTLTDKQRTLISWAIVAVMVGILVFGRGFRAFGVFFLPLGLFLCLKRDREQIQMRPSFKVLGWIFITTAVVTLVAVAFAIASGR